MAGIFVDFTNEPYAPFRLEIHQPLLSDHGVR